MGMPSLGDNVVSDGASILMLSQVRKIFFFLKKEKQDDPSVTDGSQFRKFILLGRTWIALRCGV